MTELRVIRLSEIAGHVPAELVSDWDALRPGDESEPVICERYDGHISDIVDGYHRVAGWIAWADGDDPEVTVVVTDEEDLIADAAEPGGRQAEAIEAIYDLL